MGKKIADQVPIQLQHVHQNQYLAQQHHRREIKQKLIRNFFKFEKADSDQQGKGCRGKNKNENAEGFMIDFKEQGQRIAKYGYAADQDFNDANDQYDTIVFQKSFPVKSGAGGDRTLDLLHAMQALSQLSYSPKTTFKDLFRKFLSSYLLPYLFIQN